MERALLTDKRGVYEASLQNPDGSTADACIVTGMLSCSQHRFSDNDIFQTGYPILNSSNKKVFGNSNKAANKEDWNKLLMMAKVKKETITRPRERVEGLFDTFLDFSEGCRFYRLPKLSGVAFQMSKASELDGTLKFISSWTDTQISLALS